MYKALFFIAMFASGYGIAYLLYGRKGMALRERQGKRNGVLAFTLGVVMFLWGMSLMLWVSGMSRGDTALCVFVTFAVPVVLLLAGIKTRASVRKALAEEAESRGNDESPL